MFQHLGIKRLAVDELLRRFEHRVRRGIGVLQAQFPIEEDDAILNIVQRRVNRRKFLGRGTTRRLLARYRSAGGSLSAVTLEY
jgi:hypothetical protein